MEENVIKRVMPHSQEAEQAVIGGMLLDNESIASVENLLEPKDFYLKQYGIIYEAILDLYRADKAVDLVTLQTRLKEKDAAPDISNMTYIGELIANVPVSHNAKYYAEIIKEKSTLRQLIRASEKISTDCYVGTDKVENIMQDTETTIFNILNQRRSADFVPIDQITIAALEKIQEASKSKNPVTGVPTGFIDLDRSTTGLQPSDFAIVAARPSMGKTAFVLNIAQHIAFKQEEAAAIFSLEMSKEQLVNRLLAMESRVNAQKIRTGNLSADEWDSVVNASTVIGSSKLILDDTPGITLSELRTKCRKYKLEHDIKIVFIDYLQLMSGSGSKTESRTQEISEISRGIKSIARELGIPIIALSQLSRAPEQRTDHRPVMSDLSESGHIEMDADLVMFIYRDDYYNHDSEKKGIAEIIIGKQRNGPTGTIELAWLQDYMKFVSIAKE